MPVPLLGKGLVVANFTASGRHYQDRLNDHVLIPGLKTKESNKGIFFMSAGFSENNESCLEPSERSL